MCSDTCSRSSSPFPLFSLFISSPSNLYASHAFTLHFPCWLWVSPLWRTLPGSSGCRNCANIAFLNPLGGIMAAITHWCGAKTDISLALCWQTAHTTYCSVTLSFSSCSVFSPRVCLSYCLSVLSSVSASKSPCSSVLRLWGYYSIRQRSWPLKDVAAGMEIALDSKSFTDHFTDT